MIIKTLRKSELHKLKPLWLELNAHHLSRSTNFKWHFKKQTFEMRMEKLQQREKLIAFVAEVEAVNVGYSIATIDGQAGEIDSLFVTQDFRGHNIGEKLTQDALQWLQAQHPKTLRVNVAEGNEAALEFYRKFGFNERYIVMAHQLENQC